VDGSVTNEINTGFAVNGANLDITDSAGTLSVPLASIVAAFTEVDGSVTNEINTGFAVNGANLDITDSAGTLSVLLSDISLDDSESNEVNTAFAVNGANLDITDSAGTLSVPLASIVAAFTEVDGSVTNEINTAFAVNGANLDITDSAGTLSVPLASIVAAFTEVDGSVTNEINTAFAVNGANLDITDSAGTLSVPLATIVQEPWYIEGTTNPAIANTDNIFITADWVGIGPNARSTTGGPAGTGSGEKLWVEGTIRTQTSVYADYVLEDYVQGASAVKSDYERMNLAQVKAFIMANKHLPGVTGIEDEAVVKTESGYNFDLSKLAMESLEKIEELYLHTIEQQELIEQLVKRIEQLENKNK